MNTTTQVQVRFDSRASSSISSGRVRKVTPPCIVTNAEGTTVIYDKSKNVK